MEMSVTLYFPVFGAKWCAVHEIRDPHNAGTEYYRNQIEQICESLMNWEPYDCFIEQMPIQMHNESAWWFDLF